MPKKIFKIKGHLANAFDETVSSAKNNEGELHIEIIPIRKLELDPDNPRDLLITLQDLQNGISTTDNDHIRKMKEKEQLVSMSESIKNQGVLNPIIVYNYRDKYRLIAGERRVFGSILARKPDIPAKILSKKPSSLQLSLLQWVENIEREDLSLWEKIRNLKKIAQAYTESSNKDLHDITGTDISKLLNCSKQQGTHYKNVLCCSDYLSKLIKNNSIKNLEKAALIATSTEIEEELADFCLKGATLKQLKAKKQALIKKQNEFDKKTNTAVGRPATKINFGFTKNITVAKLIYNAILESHQKTGLSKNLPDIKWENYQSITSAFKNLIKLLEENA